MGQEFSKLSPNILSCDPILYVINNFLTHEECNAFIEAGKNNLKPSTVISSDKQILHQNRTSKTCWLQHNTNNIITNVSTKLSKLVNIPINNAELFQLVYYNIGDQYKPHFDAFNYETEDGKKNWEPGGQRMVTVLAYLNDVEQGGGTGFPELNITIPAKKGNIVVFHNTINNNSAHPKINPKSLHSGMPVIKGEKWLVNLWFRQKLRY